MAEVDNGNLFTLVKLIGLLIVTSFVRFELFFFFFFFITATQLSLAVAATRFEKQP